MNTPQPLSDPAHAGEPRAISPFRWVIGGMLFLAAVLNYIDRQALALLKGTMSTDLGLNNVAYAWVNNLFLAAYLVAYLISGRLVDRWGPRLSMAVFNTWWSIANAMTAFARSATSLGCFRAALGFGEAGNWPASAKAVAEWFPARERALAIGMYTCGATIGATVAPVLVVFMNVHVGWRGTFVATGVLGLLWVVPWLLLYRPRGSADVQAETRQSAAQQHVWRDALSNPVLWILMIGRMLTDPVWYFYQSWLPSYLQTERHVSQQGLTNTWVVFLAADVGTILGGLGSSWLLRRGGEPARGRLLAMLPCALLMGMSPLVPHVQSLGGSLAIISILVLAHLAWLANASALVVDLLPPAVLATGFGVIGAGSAIGGMVMNPLVAHLADIHAYSTWFWITTFLHPLAWLILFLGVRRAGDSAVDAK